MPNIHNLRLTDTEYAKLLSQGYDPNLEHQFAELGESIDQARKLARVVGLTLDKARTFEHSAVTSAFTSEEN